MNRADRRTFITLFLAVFISVTGVGIVVPLLPVYARDLGASGFYIGLIFGSFSISRTLFLPWFGSLSDRKGRKPWIVSGLLAYALISIGFCFAENINMLIGIRFIHGIASAMIMPVTQAYVGDITPRGREGLLMGIFNMSMFASLSLGPFLGGIINEKLGLDYAFFSMGALAVAGLILAVFWLPARDEERVAARKRERIVWRTLVQDRTLAALSCFRFAYTACIGIIWCFLPVFADSVFGISSSRIGFLIMTGVIVSGLVHLPMGYLADRVSRRLLIVTGGIFVAVSMFTIQWAVNFNGIFMAVFFFGIGGGVSMPSIMAMAVECGEKKNAMGSVMALVTMAHSLGMLAGSAIAGVTMDFFSLRDAFPMGSAIMVTGIIVFMFLVRPGRPA